MSESTTPKVHTERVRELLEKLSKAYLDRRQFKEAYDKLSQLLEFDPEHPDYLLDAAIAAVGLDDVSKEAMDLYIKAVSLNPDSEALKIGLASHFVEQQIRSNFAIRIVEQAAELMPPNVQTLRVFLKSHYAESGNTDSAQRLEHEVVFGTGDERVIQDYIEALWWEGKFGEAREALATAPSTNGAGAAKRLTHLKTEAYEHFALGQSVLQPTMLRDIGRALADLKISDSIRTLADYLLLRSVVPADAAKKADTGKGDVEEYEFILGEVPLEDVFEAITEDINREEVESTLGAFDFQKEVLERLTAWQNAGTDAEAFTPEWRGMLFAECRTGSKGQIPGNVLDLVVEHLCAHPNTIVRRCEDGFLCLSKTGANLVESIISILNHLDAYNASKKTAEKLFLAAGVYVRPPKSKKRKTRSFLEELVAAAHLPRLMSREDPQTENAGSLLLCVSEQEQKRLRNQEVTLLPKGDVSVLPGCQSRIAEVLWRHPLKQFEEGKTVRIGRFVLKSRLAERKKYATYLAMDTQLDRPVVIKLMNPHTAVEYLTDTSKREALFEKLRANGRLNHPHIANLYDMGEYRNMLYFVREYIEGKPVTDATFEDLKRENEILNALQVLVRALLFTQKQGVLHLNLKPGNIYISDANELKITDFRLPGFFESFEEAEVLYPAQWRYAAPEVLSGEAGDFRSDIYSIGVLAYELIAQKHPYTTVGSIKAPADVRNAKLLPLRKQTERHLPVWDAFVMKAMHAEPGKRFQTLAEMDMELRKIQLEVMQQTLNTTRN